MIAVNFILLLKAIDSDILISYGGDLRGESLPPGLNQQAVFDTPPSTGTPRNAPQLRGLAPGARKAIQ